MSDEENPGQRDTSPASEKSSPRASSDSQIPLMGERPSLSLGPLGLIGFGPKPDTQTVEEVAPRRPSALATMASLVIVIAALKVANSILVPLMVSVFLATLLAPLVLYLQKRKIPPTAGVPLVIVLTLLVFAGLAGLVGSSINAFIQAAPDYQERLMLLVRATSSQLESLGFKVTSEHLASLVQPEAAVRFVGDTLSNVADLLSSSFLILLMTIFVLFEALVLPDKIRSALGDPTADMSQGIRVIGRLKAYVVVKTMTSLATGLLVGISLSVIGVDFALLWGLLAFLLNFIPNIGSIIAAVPAVLMAMLQLGTGGALATTVVFVVTNVVIGSLVEPKIMGQRMNLSPLIVFFSLIFWGWLWGGVGMLLSVPLTMAIRIMLDGNEATRPFAILMAGANPAAHQAEGSSFDDASASIDELPPPSRPTDNGSAS